MSILSFSTTPEQDEIILRRMRTAGETNKSRHIRDVYFGTSESDSGQVGELKRQVEALTDQVEQQGKLLRQMAALRSDGLELKLLAGLYTLLYPSVDPGIQATVDRFLDASAVEGILSAKGGKK